MRTAPPENARLPFPSFWESIPLCKILTPKMADKIDACKCAAHCGRGSMSKTITHLPVSSVERSSIQLLRFHYLWVCLWIIVLSTSK